MAIGHVIHGKLFYLACYWGWLISMVINWYSSRCFCTCRYGMRTYGIVYLQLCLHTTAICIRRAVYGLRLYGLNIGTVFEDTVRYSHLYNCLGNMYWACHFTVFISYGSEVRWHLEVITGHRYGGTVFFRNGEGPYAICVCTSRQFVFRFLFTGFSSVS